MEFSEEQEGMVERFIAYVHDDDGIDIVPAKNKKTGKIEMLIIAREAIEGNTDQINIVPLGKLYDLFENSFDKYEFDFDLVEDEVIYERKPWWNFWERS